MIDTFLQSPKAQQEIIDAWEWYEEQQDGLGDRFKEEVRRKIKSVLRNPLIYQVKGKYREAQTDIFPYLIVFKIDKRQNLILIVSVFHTSRYPKKKTRK